MIEGKQAFTGLIAQEPEACGGEAGIVQIAPTELHEFRGHTFQVWKEDLEKLKESIKEHGIMVPLVAFYNEDGELELISGHLRRLVAIELGLDVVPVRIINIDRNNATILMGELNIMHRASIRPVEKGMTYKVMIEAIRQLSSENKDEKGAKERSRDILAARVHESASQIRRFIRLTYLIEELQNLVNESLIGIKVGVELSYLTDEQQMEIYRNFQEKEKAPSLQQATRIRRAHEANSLTEDALQNILFERDEPQKTEKLTFTSPILISMLARYPSISEREDRIIQGLRLLEKEERGWEASAPGISDAGASTSESTLESYDGNYISGKEEKAYE